MLIAVLVTLIVGISLGWAVRGLISIEKRILQYYGFLMLRALIVILVLVLAGLAGCGPPLVWGGNAATKEKLLQIVPIGSSAKRLEVAAKANDWDMKTHDNRTFPKGEPHYFGDGCQSEGGIRRNAVVAEYGVFTTSVEVVWLFDEKENLRRVCVRRTTDAL